MNWLNSLPYCFGGTWIFNFNICQVPQLNMGLLSGRLSENCRSFLKPCFYLQFRYFINHSTETCEMRWKDFPPLHWPFLSREDLIFCPYAVPFQEHLPTSASQSILLCSNCSVQDTLTWSLACFKSSPLSCNRGKAEDHFQPLGFLSVGIPAFRGCMVLNIAVNLWRTSLVTTTCSSSLLPWLFLLSHILPIFVSDPEWCWNSKWARSEAHSVPVAAEGCRTGLCQPCLLQPTIQQCWQVAWNGGRC